MATSTNTSPSARYMGAVAQTPPNFSFGTSTAANLKTSQAEVGDEYSLTSSGVVYKLNNIQGTGRAWVVMVGASGNMAGLVSDSGTALPDAVSGLVSVIGTGGNGISTSATGSTLIAQMTGTYTGDYIWVSNDATAISGPKQTLFRNSATPANADILGQLLFTGKSSTAVTRTYATIISNAVTVTNASEEGSLVLGVTTAGALGSQVTLSGGALTSTVLNQITRASAASSYAVLIGAGTVTGGGPVLMKAVNTDTAGRVVFALSQLNDSSATEAYIQRFNSTHATRPSQLEIINGANATMSIGVNSGPQIVISSTIITPSVPLAPLTIAGGATLTTLTMTTTDPGITAGPITDIYRNTPFPTAAAVLGQLLFTSNSSTAVKRTFASQSVNSVTVTNAAEDGSIDWAVMKAGTLTNQLTLTSATMSLKNAMDLTVGRSIVASGIDLTFTSSPSLQSILTTGAAPVGTAGSVNLMHLQNGFVMEQFIATGTATIIAPRMNATGLLISLDLVAAEGAEYNFGAARGAAVNPFAFTVGTSPAFFFEATIQNADISGLDPLMCGFRIVAANAATAANSPNYADFASIGARNTTASNVCVIQTNLASAGVTTTNSTDTWTDGTTKVFKVLVSSAGVVTYTINGVAPTVTAAFTFPAATVVTPFITYLFGATTPAAIDLIKIRCGLQ